MKLIEIAAIGKNRELGLNGDMPWKRGLKKDLAFFKEMTKGKSIVMGRKTFDSLPGLLPGRHHIVITRHPKQMPQAVETFQSVQDFLVAYKDMDEEIFVIGGASIYKQLLPYARELILTEIDQDFPADTWFPDFEPQNWKAESLEKLDDGGYRCQRMKYVQSEPEQD